MAYVIAEPCIGVKDTGCVRSARSSASIPPRTKTTFATVEMLYINPDVCIDCGLCVDECPVQAIFPEDELPDEWKDFMEKNAAYFRDLTAARSSRPVRSRPDACRCRPIVAILETADPAGFVAEPCGGRSRP